MHSAAPMARMEKPPGACPNGGAELTRDWLLAEMRATALRSLELQLEQQERLVARFMDHAGTHGEQHLGPIPSEDSPRILCENRGRKVAEERAGEPAPPDVEKLEKQAVADERSAARVNGCVVAVSRNGLAASEFKRWRIDTVAILH